MLKRTITGVILAAILLLLLYFQGWALRIALIALMLVSFWEMYGAFSKMGTKPAKWVGILYALCVLPAYLLLGSGIILPLTTLFAMLGLGVIILRGKVDFPSAMGTIFPLIYPGLMVALIIPMQDMDSKLMASMALTLAFVIAFLSDVFAFEIGVHFGKRKLSPAISPNKTIEGAVAGLAGGIVAGGLVFLIAQMMVKYVPFAMKHAIQMPPVWHFALLGLVGSAASQIGDLTASMIKREAKIKDFGNLFPGHGGMMDRMDGVLFNAVVVYMYFLTIGMVI